MLIGGLRGPELHGGWISKPIQQIVKFVQQIKITQKVVKCDQVVERPNDGEV